MTIALPVFVILIIGFAMITLISGIALILRAWGKYDRWVSATAFVISIWLLLELVYLNGQSTAISRALKYGLHFCIPYLFYLLISERWLNIRHHVLHLSFVILPATAIAVFYVDHDYWSSSISLLWHLVMLAYLFALIRVGGHEINGTKQLILSWTMYLWFLGVISMYFLDRFNVANRLFIGELVHFLEVLPVMALILNSVLRVYGKVPTPEKYGKSKLTSDLAKNHLREINDYMSVQKPFTDPSLTIGRFAKMVNIQSRVISQVINQELGLNFYNYLNQYRVREVQAKMMSEEADKYTLEAIAKEAGFNSPSSFHQAFKKVTNSTPLEYKSKLRGKKRGYKPDVFSSLKAASLL